MLSNFESENFRGDLKYEWSIWKEMGDLSDLQNVSTPHNLNLVIESLTKVKSTHNGLHSPLGVNLGFT